MSLAVGHEDRTPSGFDRLPGVTPPSSREPRSGFLTDTIIKLGLVPDEHIEAAVHDSRVQGTPPELILLNLGQLSDEDLARARAEHSGLDYVDLAQFERDNQRDGLIGRVAAERYRALPIAVSGRSLVVAFADPLDAPAIAEIVHASKLMVTPVVAGASAIEARLEELPERASGDAEQPQLRKIEGGEQERWGRRAGDRPQESSKLSGPVTDRIVERVEAAIDEVARSEILKALDDATSEIERLTAELEATQERARALENECDELRGASGASPAPDPDPS
jgi:hypothetical protein